MHVDQFNLIEFGAVEMSSFETNRLFDGNKVYAFVPTDCLNDCVIAAILIRVIVVVKPYDLNSLCEPCFASRCLNRNEK